VGRRVPQSKEERRGGGSCGITMSSGLTIPTCASLPSLEMLVRPNTIRLGGAARDRIEVIDDLRGEMCGVADSGRTVAIVDTDCNVYSDSAGC
jgi:hypothetical protein